MVAMSCGTTCRRGRDTSASGPHHVPRRARRCPRRHGGGSVHHDVVGRYHDPQTGQFLSVDPMVEQTLQAYVYAGDDPVNGSDPSGLAPAPPCFYKHSCPLGGLIESVSWACTPPGYTLTVNPSGFARLLWWLFPIWSNMPVVYSAAWSQTVVLAAKKAPHGVTADTPTMYDQFVCH